MPGSKPCPIGCPCARHSCPPGCTCSRHAGHGSHSRPRETGADSPRWLRDTTNYTTLHSRVRRARGSASAHQCVRCPAPAKHWATVHGETGEDPWADYVPMCIPCHHEYDGVHAPEVHARSAATRRARKAA